MQEPLIRLESVTRTYRMGDVSLAIDDGDFVAIMGPSGSGKSTLMNLLGCLDKPTGGTYLLNGQDVSGLGPNDLAAIRNHTAGFVFQSFNLLSRTSALENVELPLMYSGVKAHERTRRAREALEHVGLGDRLYHHPNQMSGGQQQRVALARAVVGNPKLILADEPTGNLDTETSLEIMALLQALRGKGMTVVLVTHESDISMYASRIIVMRDGRIQSDTRQEAKVAVRSATGRGSEEVRA